MKRGLRHKKEQERLNLEQVEETSPMKRGLKRLSERQRQIARSLLKRPPR